MNIIDRFINTLIDISHRIVLKDLQEARLCLLDFIGCAVYGSKSNYCLIDCFPTGPSYPCEIFGCKDQNTLAEQAAYINAYSVHSTELDDGFKEGMTHIGAVVVAAALSLSQEKDIPYKSLLFGIVMGYEATSRLSRAINPTHKKLGFHTTGTCGCIGAAVGCAFMLGASRDGIKTVLSTASASASGFLEMQENSSQLKATNAAHAAMAAITAARLSFSNLNAPDDALGGSRGFIYLLCQGNIDEDRLFKKTDTLYIHKRYMKLYPSCRHCHPAVEAALKIAQDIDVRDIENVTVQTYSLAIKGHDHKVVSGIASAKLSIPYCVAAALNDNKFDNSTFERGVNTSITNLVHKIDVVEKPEYTQNQVSERAANVTVLMSDGSSKSCEVRFAKGDPENPLTLEEQRHKFESLTNDSDIDITYFDDLINKDI